MSVCYQILVCNFCLVQPGEKMVQAVRDAGPIARHNNSILAASERRLLVAIARRLPAWVTPDQLTILGVAGGALTAVGCVAAWYSLNMLAIAVAGLALNWFGDSLDGTLARVRGIERQRYGLFVDQFCDVASHFLMLIGMGLSPLMHLDTALLALLASLLVMFYGHLKLPFTRTWEVSQHGLGPTEFRMLIAAGMALVMAVGVPSLTTPVGTFTLFDAVATMIFAAAVACVLMMFVKDRAQLAAIDPPRHKAPPEVAVVPLPAPDSYLGDASGGVARQST